MTNADLEFSVLSFLPIKQQYTDINMDWYLDVAPSLVQTMFIMAVFPYIEIVMFGSLKKFSRYMDSGFPCCKKEDQGLKTKTVT